MNDTTDHAIGIGGQAAHVTFEPSTHVLHIEAPQRKTRAIGALIS